MTIHDKVNISRLKQYTMDWSQETSPPPPPVQTVRDTDGAIWCLYVVEAIISQKRMPVVDGGDKYRI